MKASTYQERFWIDWKLDPRSPKYNEGFFYNIRGDLQLDQLKLAFEALSHKHPLLRSKFFSRDDGLYIAEIKDFKLPFAVLKINNEQAKSIHNIASQIANTPFDLQVGPLWSVSILQLNERQFWLVISLHHIIIDGNAFDLLRKDISKFYNTSDMVKQLHQAEEYKFELEKLIRPLQDVNIEYLSSGLQYYTEKLSDKTLYYELDTVNADGITFFYSLEENTRKILENFCMRYHAKPFRFIAAAFALFLYYYFGKRKFCMVYPVNMRKSKNEDILCSCINMQLLPIALNLDGSFEQLFAQITESRKAGESLTLPYEKIINYLRQRKVISQTDYANVVIAETDLKLRALNLNNLEVSSIRLPKTSLPFDIVLEYECYEGDIFLQLSIKNHWFNIQDHAQQLKQHLTLIIEWVSKYYYKPLCELPLFGLEHQQVKLNLLNNLTSFNTGRLRIEEKFYQIAKQYPENIAIIDSDRKISYHKLAQMADNLAANLQKKLDNKIELIGISMQHGVELVAVILALFKLGKTYLPLRLDLPASYVTEIITQANLHYVIADHIFDARISQQLVVFSLKDLLKVPSQPNYIVTQQNNEIAYILYTSGTTGISKGVAIKHTSVTNLISSCQLFYTISPQDVISWFHSYTFDFSVWEIWSALLNGASLLILNEVITKSPREFTDYIALYKATIINQTPTALKQWLTYLSDGNKSFPNMTSVRLIISGGEALYPHHVENLLLQRAQLRCKIFNMYGITEDCVHSTIYEVSEDFLNQKHSIVGKMLPGKVGLVIGEDNNIKPLGAAGELLISGFGVAAGYFKQESLTKNKFIKLPEIDKDLIWFKTGDQVRLLPSGNLEYLGRKDTQIKIRGYRIDYKDIEMRLNSLSDIVDSKVLANNGELLAFVILRDRITVANILDSVKKHIPHYMMPGKFIAIGAFPRTIHDKIDEKKLLEIWEIKKQEYTSIVVATDDPVINQILAIWKKTLPQSAFGLNDNFFDCGGNSLLLAVLQSHLETCFEIKLPILEFFIHPTINTMGNMIRKYLSYELV